MLPEPLHRAPRCPIVNNELCIYGFLKHKISIFKKKLTEYPVVFSLHGGIDG